MTVSSPFLVTIFQKIKNKLKMIFNQLNIQDDDRISVEYDKSNSEEQ